MQHFVRAKKRTSSNQSKSYYFRDSAAKASGSPNLEILKLKSLCCYDLEEALEALSKNVVSVCTESVSYVKQHGLVAERSTTVLCNLAGRSTIHAWFASKHLKNP